MFIFLDIDGVMVPAKGWTSPELLQDGFPVFSSKATYALRKLITGDTTILLTTSHKANYSLQEWKDIFANRGITVKKIAALDGNHINSSRKDEIMNWFNVNNIDDNFIIIDDDKSLNSLPDELKSHLILTSPMVGLTEDHLLKANAIKREMHIA